tara:strand:- start:16 stop:237 length:222 start_codon:yes stop_codon:yes gene_type:complete
MGSVMFLLVLVTCVTFEAKTLCHEFKRDRYFKNYQSCMFAAAMEKGRYTSRMKRRKWARYRWECRSKAPKVQI